MLLVIDVGNTGTVVGIVDGDVVVARWEITTTARTVDEYVLAIDALLESGGHRVSSAALASVVPEATRVLRAALPRIAGSPPVVVGPGVRTGLSIDLDNAREVGADRVAGAVGAIDRYGAPVITVDFGTATTVDLVDAASSFRGGAIAVGIGVGAEALVASTSALRRVELSEPSHSVGRSTVEAVQSGMVFGFAGMVDGLVSRMKNEADIEPVAVVATGGFAPLIGPLCDQITHVDADLTLWGLALIHRRNQ